MLETFERSVVESGHANGAPVVAAGPEKLTTSHTSVSGYCLWKWCAASAAWEMLDDRSDAGFEAGDGPTQSGRFDGQTVRWASVPILRRS